MQLILEEKIDIFNYKHSKVKHKNCCPTQCKISHPVVLKWYKNTHSLDFIVDIFYVSFENISKLYRNVCQTMRSQKNTLFLKIIQCTRVKHFYYIFFLQEKQMCDRGCGKVLKGSKLGRVFSSLKQKKVCKESNSHTQGTPSSLRGC